MDDKDLLLVEPNQYEEELIDDPDSVDDQQIVENEVELSHCIVQTEEVMQITANEDETIDTNTNDHQCTICGKELLSAYTLANHMRSHTGERPYGCSVCEKFFKTKSNLNEHYRLVFTPIFCICIIPNRFDKLSYYYQSNWKYIQCVQR